MTKQEKLKTPGRTEVDLRRSDPDRVTQLRVNPPVVLEVNEAAALLNKSVRGVREDIKRRRISCFKLGGRTLLCRDQLFRDIEALTTHAY